jgi:hypothetical protein
MSAMGERLFGVYDNVGMVLALVALPVVFLGSWIYCALTYGFILGVGLGWLPSFVCAVVAAVFMKWLWPIPALLLWAAMLLFFSLPGP